MACSAIELSKYYCNAEPMKKLFALIVVFGAMSGPAYSSDLSESEEVAVEVGQFLSIPGIAVELGAVPGREGAMAPLMLGSSRKFNDQTKSQGLNCEQAGQTYNTHMRKMNDENPSAYGGILIRLLSAYQMADCKERIK